MKLFFVVVAKDANHVFEKIEELEGLKVPYTIVCGERVDHENVVYRAARGKYDAINFSLNLIPKDVETVVMNDVDTRIGNFNVAISHLKDERVSLLFGTEVVKEGPQHLFYRILNPIRRCIPIAATDELMFIRRDILEKIIPLKLCKAEDTYILFKVLEYGCKRARRGKLKSPNSFSISARMTERIQSQEPAWCFIFK